ncbi:MAG: hypothetical protein COB07_09185 [Sulfurovum sp.]|nr:MAG: hypothetical protein COB07_09185 [Sulfurovum sp.]
MKKFLILAGMSLALVQSPIYADALKNSLSNMLNEKETSSMVDLGRINLNGKPKPVQKVEKTRSSTAVIAIVNGHKLIKKDADEYLKQRTQGKVTNSDKIPPQQRQRLIQELALPILVMDAAKKELSEEEKQMVYNRTWMQKEASKITITDEQALAVYGQLKKQSEENNSTTAIPPFDSIKERLKSQMLEKKMIGKLMENVEIKVM